MQKTCTKFSICKVKLKPQFVWASWLLILSMITLLIGCTKMDKAESKSYQVMQRFAKIQKKEGFYLGSIGGSMKEEKNSVFLMGFEYKEEIPSVEVGRRLILTLASEFMRFVNADPKIEPYVIQFPITSQNLNMYIITRQDKTGLFSVRLNENCILYMKRMPATGRVEIIHEETYEEALKLRG